MVAAHCRTFIKEHRKQGVACCLKHFPGHGSASADSHLGFVDISGAWQEQELEPYRILLREGFVDAIMTAHIIHYGLDSTGTPATLSPAIITGILREQLGFEGVIVTDDVQMKAISDRYGYKESIRRAVLAGADLMIVGNNLVRNPDALAQGVAAVQELLDWGAITEARINSSLQRIEELLKKTKSKF
ncbi:MAG: hypothetical protein D3924_14570 [Candidatus Electrothrix sp. AR4]|nr:hypothetical protein [Candidatus Electrothrix sp. AR4]